MLILGIFLWIGTLPVLPQETDSVYISVEELRTITKMTEELKYALFDLDMADSIISHQTEIIFLQNQTIDLKTKELQDNIRESQRRQVKIGVISGSIGIVLGVLLNLLL